MCEARSSRSLEFFSTSKTPGSRQDRTLPGFTTGYYSGTPGTFDPSKQKRSSRVRGIDKERGKMEKRRSGRIGVIGGGLGGLASACTLAARGYDVVLFEKNPWLGGKAAVLAEGGFRFDMGPTILLMPSVLERIFAEAGRNLKDELDLIRLDPQWRSFFMDGSVLDLHASIQADVRARSMNWLRTAKPAMATVVFSTSRRGLTTYRNGISSGGRSAPFATCSIRRPQPACRPWEMYCECGRGARSVTLSGLLSTTVASPRCSTTSHNTSARLPTSRRLCFAASRTCRPARASGIRWAAPARWPKP